jgi:hypothetical protein
MRRTSVFKLALFIPSLVFGACSPPAASKSADQKLVIPFGPFDVAPGKEVQLCRTMKLDNTDPVAINRLNVSMSTGSHHFILFRARTPDIVYPDQIFPCFGTVNFDEWDFMMDVNKKGGYDWQLEPGQAFVMGPHQQIMVQSHYVNATSVQTPEGGMTNLEMTLTPLAEVKHELKGMFTVNTRINIPPHAAEYTTTKSCSPSHPISIVAMTGHFHARGTRFGVDLMDLGDPVLRDTIDPDRVQETMYESLSWDSPLFAIFPTPKRVISDGVNSLRFSCTFSNDDPTSITYDSWIGFGGHADTQEHCNLFFQYYDDGIGGPVTCSEGVGGW